MALTNAQKQKKHRKGQTALLRKIQKDLQLATAGIIYLTEILDEMKQQKQKGET